MSKERFPIPNEDELNVSKLEAKITDLENQLRVLKNKLHPFEQSLRSAIADLLVEERELTLLYKQQKLVKKQKRLEQKKRGKNYKEPVGLKVVKTKKTTIDLVSQKEKKRLYKETMLLVHPDTFAMQEEETLATEITAKLVEIYQTGTLEELQAYHAHIVSGNTKISLAKEFVAPKVDKHSYLKKEISRLEKELAHLLEGYTYKVLTTYENPMSFVDELTDYYKDRIFKLKKRTRTK